MISKLKEAVTGARLRAGQMWREHRERVEEKRTRAAMNSEHGHGRFFLLHVPALATICAAITEWYWAILFCIEATGAIDWNYETSFGNAVSSASVWNFAFSTHWPVFLGLVCATIPIVMLSMVWLPVQFAMRGSGRWRRGSVIMVGVLANILVIVSGTVVMNHNRQDQVRDAVVIEQSAAQGRAAIEARLAFEQEQLRLALTNTNPYLNQAASVGAEEWERSYVAQARATNDPRLPQLERALGAARAADERRANIERLTIERATAAPEAASAANVEDTVGAELNTFAQYVEVWRPPFIAVICTLIGIFGAWWVLALMRGLNPRDVMRSGWADEAHRIEDKRDEPPIPSGSAQMQTVMEEEDVATGEKKRRITPKPYWRTVKKGKKERIEVPPEVEFEEVNLDHDGGARIASANAAKEDRSEQHDRSNDDAVASSDELPIKLPEPLGNLAPDAPAIHESPTHPEPSTDPAPLETLSEEELDVLLALESAADAEQTVADPVASTESDGDSDDQQEHATDQEQADADRDNEVDTVDQTEPSEREPETNPARMIAAE